MFGFSGNIGHLDVLKAELCSLLNGLKLAWEHGYRYLFCCTDSMNAKILIQDHSIDFHKYATIVQEIKDLLDLPWRVELLHTLQEGNVSVDHLAKVGATRQEKLCLFETPPPDLQVLLPGDAASVALPNGHPC